MSVFKYMLKSVKVELKFQISNHQTYTDIIHKNDDFDVYGKCEEQTNQIISYNFLVNFQTNFNKPSKNYFKFLDL